MIFNIENKNGKECVKNIETNNEIQIYISKDIEFEDEKIKEIIERKVFSMIPLLHKEQNEHFLYIQSLDVLVSIEKERQIENKTIYVVKKLWKENLFFNLGIYTDKMNAFEVKVNLNN